ncbi:MAG: hypothetical protein ABI743_06985, partial [bacterium]
MTRRVLTLLIFLLLPLHVLTGRGPGGSLPAYAEDALPAFGDPIFLPVPATSEVGAFNFEAGASDATDIAYFPPESGGGSRWRRVVAAGVVRLAYARGDQALQAIADSLVYERSDPGLEATETFTLAGNVRLATPDGVLAAPSIVAVFGPSTTGQTLLTLTADGGTRGKLGADQFSSKSVTLDFSTQQGTINGAITLTLDLARQNLEEAAGIASDARPFLRGVALRAQIVELTGD